MIYVSQKHICNNIARSIEDKFCNLLLISWKHTTLLVLLNLLLLYNTTVLVLLNLLLLSIVLILLSTTHMYSTTTQHYSTTTTTQQMQNAKISFRLIINISVSLNEQMQKY